MSGKLWTAASRRCWLAIGVANAKDPRQMSDLIERTFPIGWKSNCPAAYGKPGNDSYVALKRAIRAERGFGARAAPCALSSTCQTT